MTPAERIEELNKAIKHLKKTSKGGADFRKLIRLKALQAYYRHPSNLDRISAYYNVSVKSLKRWIGRYEGGRIKGLSDLIKRDVHAA